MTITAIPTLTDLKAGRERLLNVFPMNTNVASMQRLSLIALFIETAFPIHAVDTKIELTQVGD